MLCNTDIYYVRAVLEFFGLGVRRQDAGGWKKLWGVFRGIVNFSYARCGTVCSERPHNSLFLKGFHTYCTHGVLGVECSNHSVPTILFSDLATFGWLFHFHPIDLRGPWGLSLQLSPLQNQISLLVHLG